MISLESMAWLIACRTCLLLERLVVRVEADHAGEQLGHLDHVLGDLRVGLVHGILRRADHRRVQLLGPERGIAGGALGHDLVHDLVQVGLPLLEVVGVLRHHDLAALDPLGELEGAEAHRLRPEGVAFLLHLFLGQDGGAPLVERVGGIHRPIHGDLEREVVELAKAGDLGRLAVFEVLGPLDDPDVSGGRGRRLGVHHPLVAPDDVIRGHLAPVVELDPFSQGDLVGQAVGRDVDLLAQLQLRPVGVSRPSCRGCG